MLFPWYADVQKGVLSCVLRLKGVALLAGVGVGEEEESFSTYIYHRIDGIYKTDFQSPSNERVPVYECR